MAQLREWIRQRGKQERWHHQSQSSKKSELIKTKVSDFYSRVHWKVVMNAVHQEMYHEEHGPIREVVVDVEEEPVHGILEEGEEKVPKDVQWDRFRDSDG